MYITKSKSTYLVLLDPPIQKNNLNCNMNLNFVKIHCFGLEVFSFFLLLEWDCGKLK